MGIWHETYRIQAGGYECLYANMPRFGLAAATAHVPVRKRGQSAAHRIDLDAVDHAVEPVPAVPSRDPENRRTPQAPA